MTSQERLQSIKQKINQLIDLDKDKAIFGASTHQYEIRPAIKLSEIEQFEKNYQLELPLEYKLFLTEIANGGVGPYYGLYPFDDAIKQAVSASSEENNLIEAPFALDFPLSNKNAETFYNHYNECIADGDDDEIQYFDIPDPLTGILFLSFYGCNWSYILVVKGEQAGKVWLYGDDLRPIFGHGKQWSFFDFYEDWLNNSINTFNTKKAESIPELNATILNYDGYKLTEIPAEVFLHENLKKLVFSRNNLKKISQQLFTLKELKTLDFSMTPVVEIPAEISELTSLKKLLLNYNCLTNLPASLRKLKHLEILSMAYNNKISEIPEVVGEIDSLKELKFSDCRELKIIYENIGNLNHLESLILSDCSVLSNLPESIGNLTNLRVLSLGGTRVTKLPDSVVNLKKLEYLGIDIDLLDLEDTIEKIKTLPHLHTLKLVNALNYPDSLAELTNIKTIIITQNGDLRQQGHEKLPLPENLTLIPNLEEIDLMNNNQVSQLPKNIGEIKNLKKLNLCATSVQDFPAGMQQLSKLELIEGELNNDIEWPFGVFPAAKAKLIEWFPGAKIWIG